MNNYTLKYPDYVYLEHDLFSGDVDVDQKHHKRKLVKSRKEHTCCGSYAWEQHLIPIGTKIYFESCFLEGRPVTTYFCLKCYDRYLDDLRIFDDIT